MFSRISLLLASSFVLATGCDSEPSEPDPWSSYINDFNGDGIPDLQVFATRNAQGFSERLETDTGMDGVTNSIAIFERNAAGEPTLYEYDGDADGAADLREVRTYDSCGDLASWSRDIDVDGVSDYSEFFYRNSDGRIEYTEFDGADADPGADWRKVYRYKDGELARIEFYLIDGDILSEVETFEYENGNVVLYEVWRELVRDLQLRIKYDFGDNGRLQETHGDTNGDGTYDRWIRSTYDSKDRLVLKEDSDSFGRRSSREFFYKD